MKKTAFYIITVILVIIGCRKQAVTPDIGGRSYMNPLLSVEERVEDLLGRMSLNEKVGQMTQADRSQLESEEDIAACYLGSLLSGGGSSPANNTANGWADMVDRYQLIALSTPLNIPLIYGIDAVHGHNNVYGAVIFPHNIGLGCTRDPDLVREAARVTAEEVAGTGLHWTFAPCVAVPRDERWGRTYEGFGEDPDLVYLLSGAAVEGFQNFQLNDPASILACAKHFIGDGGTEGGDDQGNTALNETELREIHLPGYTAALEKEIGSIMATYNSWNGEKVHGNRYLLTNLLKEELAFDGFIVSDWAAIDQLPGDYKSDVEQAINAGIDMVMVPGRYREFITVLKENVSEGKISEARIDDAVSRILRIKFLLGLFENPLTDRSYTGEVGSAAHRQSARECVRQSLVLLKNDGNLLPISKETPRIHVCGKNADNLGAQCGGWTISWQGSSGAITVGTNVLQSVKNAVSSSSLVTYSLGGANAVGADVAIAVIGEEPYAEGAGDRSDLSLDQEDITLINQLKAAGVPVVAVIISGRPLIIDSILDECDAIVAAWLPGTEGAGISDVLFGDFAPTGKLSHSWPRNMSQIPVNVHDALYDPLFEYGFGLTY